VNPYLGSEIPDYVRLGLNPNTVYQLWRPAAELAKAAGSFAGKPLLSRHQPLSAAAHDDAADLVVGAVANPVWDADAGVLRAGLTGPWQGFRSNPCHGPRSSRHSSRRPPFHRRQVDGAF